MEPGGLLAALEGGFDAVIDRTEAEAAADLAFSLAQDVPLATELIRRGGAVRAGGTFLPVATVAHDYVVTSVPAALVPLRHALLQVPGHSLPEPAADVFLAALRRLARRRSLVGMGISGADGVSGRLLKAGPDHVVVACGTSGYAVPVDEILWIRPSLEGSTDGP
ncbi:MAG TPA: DUF2642 domain-containing protein [Actinomycetota bacterium]|nr:DUF2642 domain-containing protein [Actinomycetota bacterium]